MKITNYVYSRHFSRGDSVKKADGGKKYEKRKRSSVGLEHSSGHFSRQSGTKQSKLQNVSSRNYLSHYKTGGFVISKSLKSNFS